MLLLLGTALAAPVDVWSVPEPAAVEARWDLAADARERPPKADERRPVAGIVVAGVGAGVAAAGGLVFGLSYLEGLGARQEVTNDDTAWDDYLAARERYAEASDRLKLGRAVAIGGGVLCGAGVGLHFALR